VCFSNDNVTYTEWEPYTTSKTWNLTEGDGAKTVYAQFKDQTGKISTYLDVITLDTTPPTGSVAIAEGASYTNTTSVVLAITATDITSGVYQVRFSNDGEWDTEPWEIFSATKEWTLSLGDGTKSVYYQIRDKVELVSETYSSTITLDTKEPVVNAGNDRTVNVAQTVVFDADLSTDKFGIVSYEWDFGDETTGTGVTTTHVYTRPGRYTVELTVRDAAGNTATHSITITVLSPEVFPWWILGAATVATIGITSTFIWLRQLRKKMLVPKHAYKWFKKYWIIPAVTLVSAASMWIYFQWVLTTLSL